MNILIIDDDDTTIALLNRILEKEGFQVCQAQNGMNALERIQISRPDLIISDIVMPELDGFRLFGMLQESSATSDIPFIFLSAKDDPVDQLRGLRMGANEYLVKPFKASDVLNTVDKVLEKAARSRGLKADMDIGGKLALISLIDVIQLIEANEKTGELAVTSPYGEKIGSVFLSNGQVIDAVTKQLEGEEAFFELASRSDGFFDFSIREITPADKIKKETIALALEASRLNDEAAELRYWAGDMEKTLSVGTVNLPGHLSERFPEETLNRIMHLIEAGKTVREILGNAGISSTRAAGILAGLINCGAVVESKKTNGETANAATMNPGVYKQEALVKGSLVKLLRRMENKSFTGAINIYGRSQPAAIYVEQGRIVNAVHGKTCGKKAFFRILAERGGTVKAADQSVKTQNESEPLINRSLDRSLDRSLNESLGESLNELINRAEEELAWKKNLPAVFYRKQVIFNDGGEKGLDIPRNDTARNNLLQAVGYNCAMQDILEASPLPDLETWQLVKDWHEAGILHFSDI